MSDPTRRTFLALLGGLGAALGLRKPPPLPNPPDPCVPGAPGRFLGGLPVIELPIDPRAAMGIPAGTCVTADSEGFAFPCLPDSPSLLGVVVGVVVADGRRSYRVVRPRPPLLDLGP